MAFLKKIASFIPILLILGVIACIFLYKGYLDSDSVEDKGIKPPVQIDTRANLKDSVITSKKDGIKYWELEANEIWVNQDTGKSEATEVLCRFYDKEEKVYMLFEAPKADIDIDTESVFFKGMSRGMLVESGDMLEVVRLEWEGNKKKLFGYDGVKLFRSDYILTSLEMIGEPDKKHVEFIKNVNGYYKQPKLGAKH